MRANYLASPPLVVAYALAGRIDIDLDNEPLGTGRDGKPVYLQRHLADARRRSTSVVGQRGQAGDVPARSTRDVFEGDERWQTLAVPTGDLYAWDATSTYIKHPPYFDGMTQHAAAGAATSRGARVLAVLGDSITTDHISPAGTIKKDSPAGKYLIEHGVDAEGLQLYGARRGNHEVMVRGTFANIRLKNLLAPGHRGRRDAPPARRRADVDLRRRDAVPGRGRAAGRSWPARSTARARRATGRRRGRGCSACAR